MGFLAPMEAAQLPILCRWESRAGRKKLAAFWVYQANPAANKDKTNPLKAYSQDCFRTRRNIVKIAAKTKAEWRGGTSPASMFTKTYSSGGMMVSTVLDRPEKMSKSQQLVKFYGSLPATRVHQLFEKTESSNNGDKIQPHRCS